MVVLSFTLTKDICTHLLYLATVPWLWKPLLLMQVGVAITICFMNAFLCAGQDTGFAMLMSSLALLSLNNIDNVVAALVILISGMNCDKVELESLDEADYQFSQFFVVPYLIWVLFFSFYFLGILPITDPPAFAGDMQIIQIVGFICFIVVWFLVNYSSWFKNISLCPKRSDHNAEIMEIQQMNNAVQM